MTDDITNAISDVAGAPLKVEGDAGSIQEQPIKDLIAADQYTKACVAAASLASMSPRGSPWRGLRQGALVPPGAVTLP